VTPAELKSGTLKLFCGVLQQPSALCSVLLRKTMPTMTQSISTRTLRSLALGLFGVAGAIFGTAAVQSVEAARKQPQSRGAQPTTPEILATAANVVPKCITPERLMSVLNERNPKLDPKFKGIATLYKTHGEKLGLRWDYAFYQMILETNSLAFTGDVKVSQNNFAGLGATGGGVRGEVFPDVSTGVLGQLQHLVAYAGQKVDQPVAQRTRENQDNIIALSKKLGRPVVFADLTNRWAADRNYARSIDTLAGRFRDAACNGTDAVAVAPPAAIPPPAATATVPKAIEAAPEKRRRGKDLAKKAIEDSKADGGQPAALGAPKLSAPNDACNVMAASFGGSVTLLIRAETNQVVTFTALDVEGGAEQAMADSYIKVHSPSGKIAGRFKSRDEAITHAYTLCDSGKP
jgi:Mannosyl-glycoprotein endo-beta-N-acetylglucosaminidase